MSETTTGTEALIIGKIVGCFGIKGWVKIHSYTEPAENFFNYGQCTVRGRKDNVGEVLEFDVGHRHGKGLVAHIKGVDDRTLAESYKGLELSVDASALPVLDKGEFYWSQLQGMQVWCQNGEDRVFLGTVDHLIETGANDVLVVKACDGSYDKEERLIPYLPGDVVIRVDLENAIIDVAWFLDF